VPFLTRVPSAADLIAEIRRLHGTVNLKRCTTHIVKINPTRQGARRLDASTIMIDWKSAEPSVLVGINGRRHL
jgi:hypothetical protein